MVAAVVVTIGGEQIEHRAPKALSRLFRTAQSPGRTDEVLVVEPEERSAIARQIRSDSQGRKSASPDPALWADVDAAEARRWLQNSGAQTLVHGHTHRPAEHDLGDGLRRIVLSDWDLRADPARSQVLRIDARAHIERLGAHRLDSPAS